MFVRTGDYREHVGNDSALSTYYTFTPRPLVEGNFYSVTDDLVALLTDTHRTLGFLNGIAVSTSDIETLTDLLLVREICFSKMISMQYDVLHKI